MAAPLGLAAVLLLGLCGAGLAQTTGREPDARAAPGSSVPLQPAVPLGAHDAALLRRLDREAVAQLDAAQLAAQRARDPQTRRLAGALTSAFARVREGAQLLAERRGVSLQGEPDRAARRSLSALQAAPAESFDRAYAREALAGERNALAHLEEAARSVGVDRELRTFAAESVSRLRAPLHLAEQLSSMPQQG
jgi:putative membrane protein